MMTALQRKYYELGKRHAYEYDGDLRAAIMMMDDDTREHIYRNADDTVSRWWGAGFDGVEPEYVEAVRYGDIPASGRSTNWAEGRAERGVSCIRIIRKPVDETDLSIYDITLGLRGSTKYVVSGWYFGDRGSDGEPVLIGAKIVREAA